MKVEIKQHNKKLNSFKKLIKKIVNTKAKAALKPCFYSYKTHQHCLQKGWPAITKFSIKYQPMKNPKIKEPQFNSNESRPPATKRFTKSIKNFEKARKENK